MLLHMHCRCRDVMRAGAPGRRGCRMVIFALVLWIMPLWIMPLCAQPSLRVQVSGAVAHPGVLQVPVGARLADVTSAAQVDNTAYVLGAAWLRPELQRAQLRLKAGLLYELQVIALQARVQQHAGLQMLAQRLRSQLTAMPLTGRQVVTTLEPHALQIDDAANLPLQAGDQLFYPWRPRTIRVLGAVAHDCRLAQVPLRDARDYLQACPRAASADADLLYVIQPDGHVFEQGVALWNRSAPLALAPGAVLYVPLRRDWIAPAADDRFNAEMARFLATQILPATESTP